MPETQVLRPLQHGGRVGSAGRAGSKLCAPEGSGPGKPPAPHLCPVFSRCGCTPAGNHHLIWPSCLNSVLFCSPHNSPAQGWDTPLLRPTPLSLSSVTKKNICTRLQMSEGPQGSHHRQGGMLAEEGGGHQEDLAGLRASVAPRPGAAFLKPVGAHLIH